MKFIIYLDSDHEGCVGEVPAGKTAEQVCQEVSGTWIDFGVRRDYRTREDAEDELRAWAISSAGFFTAGESTPVR